MKKLAIIAIALITLQATAQDKKEEHRHREHNKERHADMKDFSAEEIAQLKTKKMTLELDLTEAQQKRISKLNLDEAKIKKAKMEARKKTKENGDAKKRTKEERLKMMNERLDLQIERKKEMKYILEAKQYEKWEKMQERKHMKGKREHHKKKGMKREKRHKE